MARLEVELGADIKDLLKDLNRAQKELKDTGKISLATGKNLQKIGTQGARGVNKLGKSTVNALPATQEFSRVIQDLPFGIQGVGNNLQQLTANFGNLSKNAGGSAAALRAMVSSLAGPAGILLAVSAVTSLFTAYGDEIINVIKGNDSLAESQKEVGKALNDFYGNQVTRLNTYVSILEDSNTQEDERKRITNELIKIVPNLEKADFNYGNNLDVVRAKIGDYVLAQASRIEADTLVEQNSGKLAKQSRINLIKNIDDSSKRISQFKKFLEEEGVVTTVTTGLRRYGNQVTEDLDDAEITKRFEIFEKELAEELKPVQDRITELYGTTFSGGLEDADADPSKLPKIKPIFDFELPQDAQARYNKFAKDALSVLSENFKTGDLNKLPIDVSGANKEIKQFVKDFDPLIEKLKTTPLEAQIFSNAIGSSFSALGQQIAGSLETGSAIVDSFVGSIISSLTKLLAEMVATSIAEKAIATTKIATNQAVATSAAISAGAQSGAATGPAGFFTTPGFIAALVAVVGAAFAGIGKFATGGFSGDNNLIRVNGSEAILTSRDQIELANFMRNNTLSNISNNPTTSSLSDGIVGEVVLRGNNQVIQLRRADRKMNRFFNS